MPISYSNFKLNKSIKVFPQEDVNLLNKLAWKSEEQATHNSQILIRDKYFASSGITDEPQFRSSLRDKSRSSCLFKEISAFSYKCLSPFRKSPRPLQKFLGLIIYKVFPQIIMSFLWIMNFCLFPHTSQSLTKSSLKTLLFPEKAQISLISRYFEAATHFILYTLGRYSWSKLKCCISRTIFRKGLEHWKHYQCFRKTLPNLLQTPQPSQSAFFRKG